MTQTLISSGDEQCRPPGVEEIPTHRIGGWLTLRGHCVAYPCALRVKDKTFYVAIIVQSGTKDKLCKEFDLTMHHLPVEGTVYACKINEIVKLFNVNQPISCTPTPQSQAYIYSIYIYHVIYDLLDKITCLTCLTTITHQGLLSWSYITLTVNTRKTVL